MPTIKKKAANIQNSTPLFSAYLNLKQQTEFRKQYCEYFGYTERTLYNRMTITGQNNLSEAEKEWFCQYFQIKREKLFPVTISKAA